ncbi:LysR family transcriptional regulator [Leifsonia shinshuensis]|uniref:LysR family transcriptional regulator n=1 Tax=Leifsonia shinshuensis TaxID=150026 RepID=UPI001F5138D2|nr:LysR family transcriptional regulator [Leifsonia shinshuensis]MCI0157082.1 LysR family transcriptional regulator [Leifsonia shinshuensis]
MNLRSLRYFEALGTELNYRRAAEKLFITQPALSAAIQNLERVIGDRLFDRDTRSVSLTATGREWLPHVRSALAGVDAALEAVALLVDYGHVRLGYLIGTGADLLFQLLDGVETVFPDITVETIEYDFSDPTAGLASGATDIALLRPPVDVPDMQLAIVAEESWVACLPRSHRLAAREELRIEELLDEPIVVAPKSAGRWREYWYAADARGGKEPQIAAEAATYEAEATLVSRGVGLSFTTSSMVRLYDRPGIQFVPITDRPVSYTAIAWRPERLTTPARRLVEHMVSTSRPEPRD